MRRRVLPARNDSFNFLQTSTVDVSLSTHARFGHQIDQVHLNSEEIHKKYKKHSNRSDGSSDVTNLVRVHFCSSVELVDVLRSIEDGVDDDEAEVAVLRLLLERLEKRFTVRVLHVRIELVLVHLSADDTCVTCT